MHAGRITGAVVKATTAVVDKTDGLHIGDFGNEHTALFSERQVVKDWNSVVSEPTCEHGISRNDSQSSKTSYRFNSGSLRGGAALPSRLHSSGRVGLAYGQSRG